jgi:hypothetical protein
LTHPQLRVKVGIAFTLETMAIGGTAHRKLSALSRANC